MISALWDVLQSIGRAFFQVIGALAHGAWDVLSGVASAVLWPVRAVTGLLFGDWSTVGRWTPWYFLLCAIVLATLTGLVLWGFWKKKQNH